MKLKFKELKEIIHHSISGSEPNEAYDKNLADDPALDKDSKYVSSARKKKIKSFLSDMGLTK